MVDFTVTQKGLEEQLLGGVIQKEQKSLEEQLKDVLEEVTYPLVSRHASSSYLGEYWTFLMRYFLGGSFIRSDAEGAWKGAGVGEGG